LNEEDVKLIKQKAKEAVYEILETEFYDAFFNLLDAFEAGIASFKQQLGSRKGVAAAVKEETFTCLKFEPQKGVRIGEFEVAYREQNLPEHWNHAFNILRQANATINNRYHGEGYAYSYWLFGEGKIYRQKMKQKT
jgi:hypothetical protein